MSTLAVGATLSYPVFFYAYFFDLLKLMDLLRSNTEGLAIFRYSTSVRLDFTLSRMVCTASYFRLLLGRYTGLFGISYRACPKFCYLSIDLEVIGIFEFLSDKIVPLPVCILENVSFPLCPGEQIVVF